jgi:hypothetical protein
MMRRASALGALRDPGRKAPQQNGENRQSMEVSEQLQKVTVRNLFLFCQIGSRA